MSVTFETEARVRIADLENLRAKLLVAQAQYNLLEMAEKAERVRAEMRKIASCGGDPKSLGGNDTDRGRVLISALLEDKDYLEARQVLMSAWEQRAIALVDLETGQDWFRLLLALIGAQSLIGAQGA